MTLREAYDMGLKSLNEASIADAATDTLLLMEHCLLVKRDDLYVHPEKEIEKDREPSYIEALEKRVLHIPVQHITGDQEFMGLSFKVNEDVLIPRFDTETLVEEAMRIGLSGMKILDMCTGSGCILLSLLHFSHDCEGTGIDISDKALAVARENAKRLDIDARFICSDLFDGLSEKEHGTYDLIVSNPPYIPTDVIPTLMPEVKDHEPILALDGSADGLSFYKRIISESPAFLHKGGILMTEIGYDQGKAVSGLMRDAGYSFVRVIRDLSGNDRVVTGEWNV